MKAHETPEVLAARRRLTDAMHAIHADSRILVDAERAGELDAAWDAYDAAVLATRDEREPNSGYFFGRPDTSNRLDVDPWSPDDVWT